MKMTKLLTVLCVVCYASASSSLGVSNQRPDTVGVMLDDLNERFTELKSFEDTMNKGLEPLRKAADLPIGKLIMGKSIMDSTTRKAEWNILQSRISNQLLKPSEEELKHCREILKLNDGDVLTYVNNREKRKCDTGAFRQIRERDIEFMILISSVEMGLHLRIDAFRSCQPGINRNLPTTCHRQMWNNGTTFSNTEFPNVQISANILASSMRSKRDVVENCQDTAISHTGDYLLDKAVDCANIKIFQKNGGRVKNRAK